MDFSNLQEKVSNLTLYDLKAGVRKVQNGKSAHFELLSLDTIFLEYYLASPRTGLTASS